MSNKVQRLFVLAVFAVLGSISVRQAEAGHCTQQGSSVPGRELANWYFQSCREVKLPSLAARVEGLALGRISATEKEKVVYFGSLEASSGSGLLKSADGTAPRAGERISLSMDLAGLSRILCNGNVSSCVALKPRLFVRFTGSESFQEIPGIPAGDISGRGPTIYYSDRNWVGDTGYEAKIDLPLNADRIEAYMKWELYDWQATGCHLAYDMNECDITKSFRDEVYLSNDGRNFRIAVVR